MASNAKMSVVAAAATAAAAGTAFVQTAGNHGASSAPVLRGAQQAQAVPGDASRSCTATVSMLSLGAAGAALLSKRSKGSKVEMCSTGKFSPGYNTLPEWEKPKNGFEGLVGDQPPLGFWDPAGYARDGNVENFKRRREVELKHGRVAMFATIGYIVPEYFKFDGELSPSGGLKFADVPNGLKALGVVPVAGWAQILAFAGFIEIVVNKPTGEPGNYGKGFLSLGTLGLGSSIQDPDVRVKKLRAEISNGRLAMFAIIGMFFQDGLTGSAWGDWALYTDSPLRAFEGELGVQAPVGFWDPVGYTRDGNVETFKRRRETEIKHGRVSMYATIGYIVPEYFKWPGYLSPSLGLTFEDVPNGLAAISKVPGQGWSQIVAFAGYYELFVYKYNGTPGDYGWKAITSSDPEALNKKLSAEIANGRLAMMAIIGMFFQDGLTGSAWGDWANYTDSPLRAFENELGVQAPVGFWDPLGLARDGDVAAFQRRRSVELKHGRIAMLATMGYITPEVAGKFPGYLSPSMGLKFEDVPNGLAAFSKVPAAGISQILLYMGWCEVSRGAGSDIASGRPGDFGWYVLTSSDPEEKQKKLSAEIANGRLAMMAIIGMFYQDGLTGSAWGDWANYTDSPLRAFENELGVQPPVGFWDPVGFTKDGSAENFKRRRSVELKHGRIAMLATIGYITPEVAGKWGGLCAAELEFKSIPNGLAALDVVPFLGWVQIFAYCGAIEYSAGLGEDAWGQSKAPGDMGWKPPFFTGGTEEQKSRRLAVELANGRLAMMAIIGMFFQDGLTGSAWGDWANYTDSPLRAFENELGVQAPIGYFDPLGMAKDGDAEVFYRRRCTEIKNGRVAMIACMGYIVPEYYRFPGYCSPTDALKFSDIPNGLAAFGKVPAGGVVQWVAFCAFLELYAAKQDQADPPGLLSGKDEGFGRVEFGRLGIFRGDRSKDDDSKKRGLNSELANGRLAMMAIIGMFFQDGLTGSAWGDWANYTDSPLRAFENELGVQAPVGFWDPLGFTKDGDELKFKRRRQVELKNGRVAMWATLGYIVPEYVRFPGYLCPSQGLKFTDVPNGLDAMAKVPVAGGMQMFLFAGFLEWGLCKQDGSRDPGDFECIGAFGVPYAEGIADPEERKRKLNAELANGRLAMFAIMGMMFQNGFLGTTGPDMWSPGGA